MLKLSIRETSYLAKYAAAFGRLCVETQAEIDSFYRQEAAAFGRLCVETQSISGDGLTVLAAAFGRLCVETTATAFMRKKRQKQPPSGGCVLKL